MGNVVSYFLAKPEAAAAVESWNAEDKGKTIEEAAGNPRQEITMETSAVTSSFDDVKIEDAKEEKETVTNISEDDFEVIEEGKTLNVNDICYEAEDVVENISKELEQGTSCKDEIENEEDVEMIKLLQEKISESTEEDVLCSQPEAKITDSVEITATVPEVEIIDTVPEVKSIAKEVETIADTDKVEEVGVNGCTKDIHQDLAKLEIETISETVDIEEIEVIGSIQDDQEATETLDQEINLLQTEEPFAKKCLEQGSPETIETVEFSMPETTNMDTAPVSQAVGDTEKFADIELIGSIESDHQDTAEVTLKQEDDTQSLEEPLEEGTEESKPFEETSCEPKIEDSFSKIIDDCKMQVENIQNNIVGLEKEISEDDMSTGDVCSCPHPEMENDICHCPHPELANEDDVCHCSHSELSSELEDRDNCCGSVENGITEANTTFLVDESGKTIHQLVYDLSEEHYGSEVMKESSMKYSEENLCKSCNSECDSETAGGEDLDKNLDLSSKHVQPEKTCDREEIKEHVDVGVIAQTEKEVDLDPYKDALDVEIIGSIQDCKSGIEEANTLEPKIKPIPLTPEPIRDTYPEPNRTQNQDNEDDEACSILISAKENLIGNALSDGE